MDERVASAGSLELEWEAVDPADVLAGEPRIGHRAVHALGGCETGVWAITEGTVTDVEADEVFVVLSGRATIDIAGGPTLEVGPGDLGVLHAGERTTWTIHEPLRKVYVSA